MTAAIALAVVLVVAVAGMSLAMQAQNPQQAAPRPQPQQSRGPRVPGPPRRMRERRPTPSPPPPPPAAPSPPPEAKPPELLRTGSPAPAKVLSVVDERTLGLVTRSRLNIRVEPVGGESWEVTVRVAFQTPEARAGVRVGGTVQVRYDPADHNRVVVEL
ncbi:MAG: hypothetical protein ACRDYC_06975 [Acidimicrobiales bacterium]